MKKIKFITSLALLLAAVHLQAQDNALEKNSHYTGASATKKQYKAIYQLDQNDPHVIEKTFRNINNALSDSRLTGKLQVELIAFSGGTNAYLKNSKYEEDLKKLVEKGVIVAQCNNTLKERNISRDSLYNFIAIVPSGNGELIIREQEGWTIIKP
jgi:uncharacterized protein